MVMWPTAGREKKVVTEELKGSIEDTGAMVNVPALPAVRGEMSRLAHVFQNVVSNALKYRRKDVPPRIDFVPAEAPR